MLERRGSKGLKTVWKGKEGEKEKEIVREGGRGPWVFMKKFRLVVETCCCREFGTVCQILELGLRGQRKKVGRDLGGVVRETCRVETKTVGNK